MLMVEELQKIKEHKNWSSGIKELNVPTFTVCFHFDVLCNLKL